MTNTAEKKKKTTLGAIFSPSDNMFANVSTAADFLSCLCFAKEATGGAQRSTLGAVLADEGALGVAGVRAGLAALVQGHTHVAAYGRARWRALLALAGVRAVHPAQPARRIDVTQAEPGAALPAGGGGGETDGLGDTFSFIRRWNAAQLNLQCVQNIKGDTFD